MKRWIGILLCPALILAVTGCGNNSSVGKPGTNQPAELQSTNEEVKSPESTTAPDVMAGDPAGNIDVDLTVLSSTMVYAEVYNMMVSPEEYVGKTVKMEGLFAYYQDETTGIDYFACIIQDATACCAQGIEFVLTEDYTYPDDYPEVDTEICVVGVFDTYQEGNYTYCTLRNANFA